MSEMTSGLVERLRADLQTAIRQEVVALCETCRAPLFEGDDFFKAPDGCSGCWDGMTSGTARSAKPCYAYRIGGASHDRR